MTAINNDQRLALVTGTSSGIGAALAPALLERGWAVIGLARHAAEFDHPRYRHVALDLADLGALETAAMQELEPAISDVGWSRVALVNNAALSGQSKRLEHTAPGPLHEMLAVNTTAPMFLMGLAARVPPPAVPLRIVNVSSGAFHRHFRRHEQTTCRDRDPGVRAPRQARLEVRSRRQDAQLACGFARAFCQAASNSIGSTPDRSTVCLTDHRS